MFYKLARLQKELDVSASTAKRICKYIRESPKYHYKKDYLKIGGMWRYNVDSFITASNERGNNENI